MVKFLIYVTVIFLFVLGIYVLVPDYGVVEVRNENFYFETSIEILVIVLTVFGLILSLAVLFIFWILRLPSIVKSTLDNYFYKKKVENILDIMYLMDSGHLKDASKKYNEKDFRVIDHKMVDKIKNRILDFKKNSK